MVWMPRDQLGGQDGIQATVLDQGLAGRDRLMITGHI